MLDCHDCRKSPYLRGLGPWVTVNRFDAGPVRLASIVHAFNYRVAVLRDGAKAAVQTACSRKAERDFLTNVSLPWGQQVAVMFQALCALVLDVPAAAVCLAKFQGVSPNVVLPPSVLPFEPWGLGVDCGCRSSDRIGSYLHELTIGCSTSISQPASGGPGKPGEAGGPGELGELSAASMITSSGKVHSGWPGSVPFMSD